MSPVPSGRVHNLINIAAYSVLAAGALYAARQELLIITPAQALNFTLAYAAGTFLLSPDLDLAEGRVDSKRHWGVLGALWVPYGMLFSHRGWSHSWLIGPLTRLLYVALIVALVAGLIRFVAPDAPLPSVPQPVAWKLVAPLLLGYYLSQWLHLIADGVRPDHGLRKGYRKVRGR
ncbi:hydrolase [Deinococcus arenae]|uniref:Hydrolase n=2 Tax=Deinococcus TaxID=1298 RepID=A0A8H9GJM7_9DEIO|nr:MULTISPECIES: metal-binding protein [Deinococcus]ALW88917.1 hydrolase [Deinococcus actinosclerus]AWT35683.1 hydrolase [Deinococcus actinosclerus]GGM32749.1 hydrolase [Deinococcus arenae]